MDKKKVVSSLAYKFIERLSVKGIAFAVGIILARLLAPEYFGILAILMVFINLSQTIVQSGFNTALVQSKNVTAKDYSTVFYICILLAAIMVLILNLFAPIISYFYNTQELILPLRVLSIVLVIGAFNSIQVVILQRSMRFKETMYCSLITTIFAGIAGIYMAYRGFGLWTLVWYNIIHTILSCITMAYYVRWFPKLEFSVNRMKDLFSYGWKMLISALLCSLYNDMRSLIIGKMFTTADLAYYNRGQQYPDIVANTLDNSIQSVMFPVMSKEQDNKKKFVAVLSRTVSIGTFIIVPLMFWMATISKPFVEMLLTDKWLPCVEYMQLLSIGFASIPMTSSCLVALKSTGRSDIYMKLEFVRRIIMLLVLLISVFIFKTVVAIAIGFVISSWIDVIVISIPIKRLLGYGIRQQLRNVWKTIIGSLILFVCCYSCLSLQLNNFTMITMQGVVAIIVYIACSKILKNEGYTYLIQMIRRSKND